MAAVALELETAEPAVAAATLMKTVAQPALDAPPLAATTAPTEQPTDGQRRWVRPFLLLLLLAACMGAAYYYGLESASR
jgi:hypothetical protein